MIIYVNDLNSNIWKTKPIHMLSQDIYLKQRKKSIRLKKDTLANTSHSQMYNL